MKDKYFKKRTSHTKIRLKDHEKQEKLKKKQIYTSCEVASNSILYLLWLQLQSKSPLLSQNNLFKLWICNPKISCCHDSMKLLLPIIMDHVFQKFDYIAIVFRWLGKHPAAFQCISFLGRWGLLILSKSTLIKRDISEMQCVLLQTNKSSYEHKYFTRYLSNINHSAMKFCKSTPEIRLS